MVLLLHWTNQVHFWIGLTSFEVEVLEKGLDTDVKLERLPDVWVLVPKVEEVHPHVNEESASAV